MGQVSPTRSGFRDFYGDIWVWDKQKYEWDVQLTTRGRNAFHLSGVYVNVNESGEITH